MVNRAETLSNLGGLPDVTAWRAIRNAERSGIKIQPATENPTAYQHQSHYPNQREIITIYKKPEGLKSQPTRIAQLNEDLTRLHKLKKEGNIATKEQKAQYRMLRAQYKAELHEEEEKRKHNAIRTRKKQH